MRGRVVHQHVAFPRHIAGIMLGFCICEQFVNLERIFLYEPCFRCMYCPGHAGVKDKGDDQANRLAGEATVLRRLSERFEMLRSLRHNLRSQSQRPDDASYLEERHIKGISAQQSSLIGQAVEMFQR